MRLLVVSNRLPITVEVSKELCGVNFKESVGGLVSGLSAYLDSIKHSSLTSHEQEEYIWIGWPGMTIDNTLKDKVKEELYTKFHAYPVFIDEKRMDNFYHGFCNKTIWPLFHYFPYLTLYNEIFYEDYKQVNEIFCDTVMEIAKPEDLIWIHDYHLMLLPKLLREKLPESQIGFFLHIPFPSFEIFRLLPGRWRVEILEGLIGADLIGFHTHEYAQYFLRCLLRILGYEHNMGIISLNDRIVKVDTFPMGIDFKKFNQATKAAKVQEEREILKNVIGERKVILSIDRLDYSKGINKRLQAYEIFLERNPQYHQKVVLILVVVPSRIGIEQYQHMKVEIEQIVGKINGRFGNLQWSPVLYQYKYLPFEQLTALYSAGDVLLVTPLRDGMNLIAKEYVATKADKRGVLVLSEMAGAEKELVEAIIINPNNVEEIVSAIGVALEMSEEEQIRRNEIMQIRLKRYDVVRWAEEFMKELTRVKNIQKEYNARLLNRTSQKQLINDFKNAKSRIIFLDYDGTLVPFENKPELAKPPEEVLEILKYLIEIPNTELVLISGRDKETLSSWFGSINAGLVAEHGVWFRRRNEDWKMSKTLTNIWKGGIKHILELFVDRIPGSFVEEKDFSLAFHYRAADSELSAVRVKELVDNLINFTANIDVQIIQGNKVLEVRDAGVNKGSAGLLWLTKNHYDFIMAIGDDLTDEDLFKVLPANAYSIKVGMGSSNARFNLRNQKDVIKLIEDLIKS